jgi:hypothetical protein
MNVVVPLNCKSTKNVYPIKYHIHGIIFCLAGNIHMFVALPILFPGNRFVLS